MVCRTAKDNQQQMEEKKEECARYGITSSKGHHTIMRINRQRLFRGWQRPVSSRSAKQPGSKASHTPPLYVNHCDQYCIAAASRKLAIQRLNLPGQCRLPSPPLHVNRNPLRSILHGNRITQASHPETLLARSMFLRGTHCPPLNGT